jgi:hypothetical protein
MTIAYSANLGLINITTGTESGLWGNYTNTNICTLLEQAISGYATYACTGGTDTITITSGASSTARNAYIKLTGTGGGNLVVPDTSKLYFINNTTSGAVTVKGSVAGVSIPINTKMLLISDGAGTISEAIANMTTTGSFTTLAVTSTVSGAGFTAYFASPPAIGGTVPAAGAFSTLTTPALTTTGDSFGPGMTIGRYVTLQEARSSTIVLADDTYLTIASIPAGKYAVSLLVQVQGSITTTQGFQWGFRAAGGAIGGWVATSVMNNTLAAYALATSFATVPQYTNINTSTTDFLLVNGYFSTGSPGAFAFQWCQRSSSANATLINSGGYMTVTRVG